MGDGFNSASALDLNQYRGKVLRMNLNGTAPTDNPLYDGGTITARDYIYTYGHRNPFGGAWDASTGKHWVVENGNGLDRLMDLTAGQSYAWAGNDQGLLDNARYIWQPATAPVNITFVQPYPQAFNGSLFPSFMYNHAFVTLSGPTYAGGVQANGKRIEEFSNLTSFVNDGNPNVMDRLAVPPSTFLKYNGTGTASLSALAAGPDGLYFADLYPDTGGNPTAVGAKVYRIRYVDFHPTNVSAGAGNQIVNLNWTANSLATKYNVYRKTEAGSFVQIATGLTGMSYTDANVVNGTNYTYAIRGVNLGGESQDSNTVTARPQTGVGQPPTVAQPAAAVANTAFPLRQINLSVLGADVDEAESNLRYTWINTSRPAGANAPTFLSPPANGVNASKNMTVDVTKAGTYTFQVTIADSAGFTTTSSIDFTVNQVLSGVVVIPASATLPVNATQQFNAEARDQFNEAMATSVSWTLEGGNPGWLLESFTATAVVFRADATTGTATVRATSGTFSGTATATVSAVVPGLKADFFDHTTGLNVLPDLTGRPVDFTRTDAQINYPSVDTQWAGLGAQFADTFVSRHTGFINIATAGDYTFYLNSDDGSRLWIDDVLLVDNDGLHGMVEIAGTRTLSAGFHSIRVEFFENGGGAGLIMSWAGPGITKQVVPAGVLFLTSGNQAPNGYSVNPHAHTHSPISAEVHAEAIDPDDPPSSLTYTWSATGPGTVNFEENGNFAAHETEATFDRAGTYNLTVVVRDPSGNTLTSNFNYTVVQVLTSVTVTPSPVTLDTNATQQFAATARDQYGDALTSQPGFTWSIDNPGPSMGSINATGLYTAPSGPNDSIIVRAAAGATSGTAAVTVVPAGTNVLNFPNFSSTAGLTLNGNAATVANALQLTPNLATQIGSVFSTNRVGVNTFTTNFSFQTTAGNTADGFTITIQGSANTAIGFQGGGLGYGSDSTAGPLGIPLSVAIKFDLYNNQGEGINSTGLYLNGAAPTNIGAIDLTPSGIDLHSGHVFNVGMTYNGTTLTVTITDATTSATATQNYTVNIPQVVGGSTAFVGFTGATGGLTAKQDILSWTYSTSTGPTAPAAPTNLGATAGNGQVSLTWNASSGATSYNVYRGTTAGGESPTPFATGITGAAYTDSTVTNGVTYYYKLSAVNAGGESPLSTEASATPQMPAPAAPTNLGATGGNAQVALSWSASAGAATYNVYRGTTAGGESPTPFATGIIGAAYTDSTVTNGVAYYYKVAAVNAGGTSAQSNEASATPQIPAPAAPANLAATGGNAQVALTWNVSATATSYRIYRATTSNGQNVTPLTTVTTNSFTDTSVTNGVAYYYKLSAVNAGGESPRSNEASATPTALGTGNGLFGTYWDNMDLTGTTVTRTDTTVNFNWGSGVPVAGTGADTFSVRWTGQVEARFSQTYTFYTTSDDGVRLWVNGVQIINNWTNHAPMVNTGTIALVAGQKYNIVMEYFENGSGAVAILEWSSASQARQVIPQSQLYSTPPIPPPAPSNLVATAVSSSQINLTWTDNSTTENGFQIDRATNSTFTTGLVTVNVAANTTSYQVGGLAGSTTYFYRARATNGTSSAYSNTASATTQAAGTGDGLSATYWNDIAFTGTTVTRIDPTINFNWNGGSPSPAIGPDSFSARWTGQIQPRYSQTYTFYTTSDDGVRLWVNGVQIINNWTNHAPMVNTGTIALTAGQKYNLVMEFYENGGGATAILEWSSASQAREVVPQSQLFSGAGVGLIASGLNFGSGFASTAGLTLNGTSAVSGTALNLTNGANNQAGSVFSSTASGVSSFNTQFDFQIINPGADGLAFVIQNVGATALGGTGGGLGYAGLVSSLAVKFDIYNNAGEGVNSTGVFTNGASPYTGGIAPNSGSNDLTGTGIDLRSGRTFRASISYNGTTLGVTLNDLTTGATATQTYLVNIPGIVGGSSAYVGFTGGTGDLTATQSILNWTYNP